MDWMKVALNVGAAVAASLVAQHVLPDSIAAAVTAAVAVVAGLLQDPPHK